jgi:hypothetical protein
MTLQDIPSTERAEREHLSKPWTSSFSRHVLPTLERYFQAEATAGELEARVADDPELCAASLAACDSLIRARIAVAHALQECGWTPPPGVAGQIEQDEVIARLSPGANGG